MEELTNEQINEISKSIQLIPTFSSNVLAIGYDETKQILKVIFKSKGEKGNTYVYFNVEPEIWEALRNTKSVGKQLSESVIRNKEKYKYRKL